MMRSFVRRDKEERKTQSVRSTSIMGQVLIDLSKANLLDPEKMFSEGQLFSLQTLASSLGLTLRREKEHASHPLT